MQADCPHATDFHDNCPAKCNFAICSRPTYSLTIDPELVFSADVDREAAIKDVCLSCEFFLSRGPRVRA
jgi:hypothetical protein